MKHKKFGFKTHISVSKQHSVVCFHVDVSKPDEPNDMIQSNRVIENGYHITNWQCMCGQFCDRAMDAPDPNFN